VEDAFASLPERYVGLGHRAPATVEIRLDDAEQPWQVILGPDDCAVSEGEGLKPDVVIETDRGTWLALRSGRKTGLEAFEAGALRISGSLDLALAFEGMFRLPDGKPPKVSVHEVKAGSQRISTLSTGSGPEAVILLHGLGSDKSSFFTTVTALAGDHTVHAIDFPGFGASSKPAAAPYNAQWFARRLRDFMDTMQIDRAHLVGNSMGGRIAIELGLLEPHRVSSLSLLTPALAWRRRRTFLPLVRMLRPELAAVPHPILAPIVRDQAKSLFFNPDKLDPQMIEITAEEFCRQYRDRNARIAFYAAARNIYLDEPFGEHGLWTRLGELEPPAMFVFGENDMLVPAGFSRHVEEALPDASCIVLPECGHVPQIEHPARTHKLVRQHIRAAAADLESSASRWPMRAAS
jgi:pimeloyl-ACP methyl ester carboxylesterase/putative sterol carrier protein